MKLVENGAIIRVDGCHIAKALASQESNENDGFENIHLGKESVYLRMKRDDFMLERRGMTYKREGLSAILKGLFELT
jgi:hypothetical protein